MTPRKWIVLGAGTLLVAGAAYFLIDRTATESPMPGQASGEGQVAAKTAPDASQIQPHGGLVSTSRSAAEVPSTMAPEKAYTDAYSILRCTHAANADLSIPKELSKAEAKQLADSRIAGLDCAALDSKYSAYDLAKFAAERGNLQAQLDFSAIAASAFNEEKNALDPALIAQYKRDSLRFLNMAADRGHPDAYARLAENYKNGLFSDQDKVKAYAYAYANSQVTQSKFSKEWLNRYSNGLTAQQVIYAQQLAQTLVNRK
ncbi:sel1 repeat family protein [Pseudoxanthomonas yeongjuensis]|uniref:sel1 repeat family protein n=1 Tax=Pseudoxanthomonas yeongjuensis TaxID=377616 RepID=UPI00139167B3|nr:sel1 repeat family protein [Pseudoxanthomonas yeongjuensis]